MGLQQKNQIRYKKCAQNLLTGKNTDAPGKIVQDYKGAQGFFFFFFVMRNPAAVKSCQRLLDIILWYCNFLSV